MLSTNRFLNSAATVVLSHRRTFTFWSTPEETFEREQWINAEQILANLRHLTVEKPKEWPSQDSLWFEDDYAPNVARFEPFNAFIARIANLKSLTWNAGPVPVILLKALHKHHRKAVLRVFCFHRLSPYLPKLDEAEIALSSYPTLTHLRASPTTAARHNLATWMAIMSNSQSLEYAGLVLKEHFGEQQIVEFQTNHKPGRFSAKKCQSLKSLTLDGAGLQLSKTFLQWLDLHTEISNLEALKLSRGLPEVSYFKSAAMLLPNLKHVSLNFAAVTGRSIPGHDGRNEAVLDAARAYLLHCSPLQTLSIWQWKSVVSLQDLLEQHGRALTSLQLHQKEIDGVRDTTNPMNPRNRGLSLSDVQLIRRSCPNLRDLTIDMTREEKSYNLSAHTTILQQLDELTRAPPLQKVQLYFDTHGLSAFLYGDPDEDSREADNVHDCHNEDRIVGYDEEEDVVVAADPESLLRDYVQSIWKHLYGNATTGERSLDVKLGDWEARTDQYTMRRGSNNRMSFWPDSRRHFVVRPNERDDMVGECVVKVRKKRENIHES